jgi:uncharacterized repeat protein (TIGR04138 family)
MSSSESQHSGAEVQDLETAIRQRIVRKDPRFQLGAYLFLYEALASTQRELGRDDPKLSAEERHVSGQELVQGIKALAADQFGPLAPTVFRSWGLDCTRNFGEIVFNLVESQLLGKTENDSLDDFTDGFDFDSAFDGPPNLTIQ